MIKPPRATPWSSPSSSAVLSGRRHDRLYLRPPFHELATAEGGFRMATSVGGVLTGRGADVILVDDPLKPTDAMSESRRRAANDWFDSTLYSRLNDKTKGAIVIVMQRLHEDDLTGHVLKAGGWEVISFSAIAEVDEEHALLTPFGRKSFRRSGGEALQEGRESLETLKSIRATIGEMNFAAQYQQTPAPRRRRHHRRGGQHLSNPSRQAGYRAERDRARPGAGHRRAPGRDPFCGRDGVARDPLDDRCGGAVQDVRSRPDCRRHT
jgi:hypothetical protein